MDLLERLQEGVDATALAVHELTAATRQLRATEAALVTAEARAALSERLVGDHLGHCRLMGRMADPRSEKVGRACLLVLHTVILWGVSLNDARNKGPYMTSSGGQSLLMAAVLPACLLMILCSTAR